MKLMITPFLALALTLTAFAEPPKTPANSGAEPTPALPKDNNELFQSLDVNRDGSISREEFARLPWVPGHAGAASAAQSNTGTAGGGTDTSGSRIGTGPAGTSKGGAENREKKD